MTFRLFLSLLALAISPALCDPAPTDTRLRLDGATSFAPSSLSAGTANQALGDITRLRGYGYIGDGASHPLSGITSFGGVDTSGWTLAQWKAVIPQALASTDEIDGLALQQAVDAGADTLELPISSRPQLSRAVASGARDITVECHDSTFTTKSTSTPSVWSHGTDANPATGSFQMKDCRGLQAGLTPAPLAIYASFQNGAGGVNKQTARFINTSWKGFSSGISLMNAGRSIELEGNTVSCLDLTYCSGNAYQFAADKTAANTAGQSFSYTLIHNQALGYGYGYSFQIGANGNLEGVVMMSNRAYGKSFIQVTNAHNAPPSAGREIYQYGSPFWHISMADWQGWGDFADLAGLASVVFDDPYLEFDPTLPTGQSAPRLVRLFNISQSYDIKVRHPQFYVLAVTSPWELAYTDPSPVNKDIRFEESFVQSTSSRSAVAGFYWDAAAGANASSSNAFTIGEKDTFYNAWASGPPKDVDVGRNQIDGSDVEDANGGGYGARATVDWLGNIDYSGSAVLPTDNNGTGTLTLSLPSICRSVQVFDAQNGGGEFTTKAFAANFTASQATIGTRNPAMIVNTGLTAKERSLRLNYKVLCR